MPVQYGSLPFAEQIDFLRKKLNLTTQAWTDVYAAEHEVAFMVAGAAKAEIVAGFRAAIDQAISQGTTIAAFRKDFDRIVAANGWSYNGGRGWRTRVIYDTNVRQSYNAGREAQMADPELQKRRPYGRYKHGDSVHPRPMHLAWDGTVLPLDDPWWETHSPQNGWGCKCKKFMLSARDVARRGLTVAKEAPQVRLSEDGKTVEPGAPRTVTRVVGATGPSPRTVRVPEGIDPGFEYRPGTASRLKGLTPAEADPGAFTPAPFTVGTATKPPLASVPRKPFDLAALLPPHQQSGWSEEEYVRRFLAEFGAGIGKPVVYEDVTGEPLAISEDLFRDRKTDRIKVLKADRERYLPLLADTLKDPAEVWVTFVQGKNKPRICRRYIGIYEGEEGKTSGGFVVFDLVGDAWQGTTAFWPRALDYLDEQRQGVRLYLREK